jgi:hypothetical protein
LFPFTIPLTCLTRKGIPWEFNDQCHSAFQSLKDAFVSAPILLHWKPDVPLIVETDASDYALAAILSIIDTDREVHPVVFLSRTFSTTELNYDIHNKELLAIFEAFKAWWHYLEGAGTLINIVTDHKNLVYFLATSS